MDSFEICWVVNRSRAESNTTLREDRRGTFAKNGKGKEKEPHELIPPIDFGHTHSQLQIYSYISVLVQAARSGKS